MCPRGRIVTGKPRGVHTHGGALLHDKREKCLNAATQTSRGAQLHSQAQQAACRTTPGTDDAQDGRRGGGAARAGGGTRNGSFVSPGSPAAWRPDHRIKTIPSSAREGHNKGGPTRARAGRGPDPGHAHPPLGGGSRPHEGANAVRTGTHRHRKECVPWPPRGGVPGQGSQLLAKTVSVCLLQLPRTLKAGELVRKQIPVAHACGGSGPGTDPSATLPGPSRVTTCWRGDPGRKDAWGPRRTTLIPETGPLCHFRNQ